MRAADKIYCYGHRWRVQHQPTCNWRWWYMALASELLPLLPICLMRTVQSRESFVSTKSESNVNAYSIYILCMWCPHWQQISWRWSPSGRRKTLRTLQSEIIDQGANKLCFGRRLFHWRFIGFLLITWQICRIAALEDETRGCQVVNEAVNQVIDGVIMWRWILILLNGFYHIVFKYSVTEWSTLLIICSVDRRKQQNVMIESRATVGREQRIVFCSDNSIENYWALRKLSKIFYGCWSSLRFQKKAHTNMFIAIQHWMVATL